MHTEEVGMRGPQQAVAPHPRAVMVAAARCARGGRAARDLIWTRRERVTIAAYITREEQRLSSAQPSIDRSIIAGIRALAVAKSFTFMSAE